MTGAASDKTSLAGGLYVGYGLVVVGVLVLSVWVATQYAAWRLGFSGVLGEPLLSFRGDLGLGSFLFGTFLFVGGCISLLRYDKVFGIVFVAFALFFSIPFLIPIYAPFHFFYWYIRFNNIVNMPEVWERGCLIIALPSQFAFVAVWYLGVRRARQISKPSETHGSAHFASFDEINDSNVLDSQGVFLGRIEHQGVEHYLQDDGAESVLVVAPSRSGKGVGVVIPTLLSWKESVFVNDIKGENWAHTAGYRSKILGQKCIRFSPLEDNSQGAKYNPLLEIRPWPNDVKDAQNLAEIICDPEGAVESRYWDASASDLLCAVILHVLYVGNDKTLTGCLNFLCDPDRAIEETLDGMLVAEHDPTGRYKWVDPATNKSTKTHPVISRIARSALNKADREFSGVLGTLVSFLKLYRDPVVQKNMSQSDFSCRDLMFSEQPISLYIVVSPEDLKRAKPLIRLLVTQITHRLTEKMEFEAGATRSYYKHRLLMMLDEFAVLGKLDVFQSALSYLPGYGIKSVLIAQDLSQLYSAYSRDESISSNCRVRIVFAPNKYETAKVISDMCGVTTVKRQVRTYTGNRFSVILSHIMAAEQESQRPLLTPDEVMRLGVDDALIFVAGAPVIKAKKIRFFCDPVFAERVVELPEPIKEESPRTLSVWNYGNTGDSQSKSLELSVTKENDRTVLLDSFNEADSHDIAQESVLPNIDDYNRMF